MPTVYPEINLVSFFGDSVEFDPRSGRVEQGRGGVIDRKRIHFINATKRTYSLNATLKDRDDLQEFLEDNRGTPFVFRFNGVSPGLFITKGWTWTWVVYAEGNGVWKLSLNLEEVFRPGWVPISTGSGALTLSIVSTLGAGNIISASPIGSGTLTLEPVGILGNGITNRQVTGEGNLQLDSVGAIATGSLTLLGSGALESNPIATSGEGTAGPPVIGSGSLAITPVELTAIGNLILSGQGDLIVENTLSGLGGVIYTGSSTLTIEPVVMTGTGTVDTGVDERTTATGDTRITATGDTRITS
jgi:hypothetical protein